MMKTETKTKVIKKETPSQPTASVRLKKAQIDRRISCGNCWSYKRKEQADKALRDSLPFRAYAVHEYKPRSRLKAHHQKLEQAKTTWTAVEVATMELQKKCSYLSAKVLNSNFFENGAGHVFKDVCRHAMSSANQVLTV